MDVKFLQVKSLEDEGNAAFVMDCLCSGRKSLKTEEGFIITVDTGTLETASFQIRLMK